MALRLSVVADTITMLSLLMAALGVFLYHTHTDDGVVWEPKYISYQRQHSSNPWIQRSDSCIHPIEFALTWAYIKLGVFGMLLLPLLCWSALRHRIDTHHYHAIFPLAIIWNCFLWVSCAMFLVYWGQRTGEASGGTGHSNDVEYGDVAFAPYNEHCPTLVAVANATMCYAKYCAELRMWAHPPVSDLSIVVFHVVMLPEVLSVVALAVGAAALGAAVVIAGLIQVAWMLYVCWRICYELFQNSYCCPATLHD